MRRLEAISGTALEMGSHDGLPEGSALVEGEGEEELEEGSLRSELELGWFDGKLEGLTLLKGSSTWHHTCT
jgi:hypothetical protein